MLKGILHRLDHSASAHEVVECNNVMNIGEHTENYLMKEFGSLRKLNHLPNLIEIRI